MMRPDFIVVGVTYDNGVLLLASKTLSYAELKREIELPDFFDYRTKDLPPKEDVRIIAKIKDYIEVWDETYSGAWQELFRCWSPDSGTRRELSGVKELPR